jgi:hypothetical protein
VDVDDYYIEILSGNKNLIELLHKGVSFFENAEILMALFSKFREAHLQEKIIKFMLFNYIKFNKQVLDSYALKSSLARFCDAHPDEIYKIFSVRNEQDLVYDCDVVDISNTTVDSRVKKIRTFSNIFNSDVKFLNLEEAKKFSIDTSTVRFDQFIGEIGEIKALRSNISGHFSKIVNLIVDAESSLCFLRVEEVEKLNIENSNIYLPVKKVKNIVSKNSSIDLPSLERVEESIEITDGGTHKFPSLKYVGGNIFVCGDATGIKNENPHLLSKIVEVQ